MELSVISGIGELYEIIPRETVLCTEIVPFWLALPLGDREPHMSPSSEVTGVGDLHRTQYFEPRLYPARRASPHA